MTNPDLARSYLAKAQLRLEALAFLLERGGYSDVVREAQELVELAAGLDRLEHDVTASVRPEPDDLTDPTGRRP